MNEALLPLYKKIENHALLRADDVAVTYEQTELTYAQLNTQANKLAHQLLARKATRGSSVVVYISPSASILVAILGIHKIGAVYVPVDPSFPSARVSAILNEVNPVIILFNEGTEGIPTEFSSTFLKLGDFDSIAYSALNPDLTVGLEEISHIYFTSGTTGKPKGVLSTHQNLIHYISTAIDCYGFTHNDLFLAGARFTFSISMFELMVPLVAGGRVRILPRETVLDLSRLSIAVASATVFHFGPSLLKQLLPYIENNYPYFDLFDRLKHVSSGGDMVPPEVLEKLKKIFRNAEVFVIYGSSEISCMGCTYEVPRNITISRTLVGTPLQNVKVKILGDDGNMVHTGMPGKIYFSGRGLVKGYLNLPELTNEKFTIIDDERYYAIGDIGRFDQDGNIELLGREDYQVQIRGMRVEILEVEACIKSFPAIADCVVVGRALQVNGEKSLIGYLVAHNHEKIVVRDLKKFISEQLPDYMIPALFVKLDRLPTNHNAKLDRGQLPRPSTENIIVSAEYKTATNETEKALIKIWEDLFNIKNVGIDHDFFDLGGDSLLAVAFVVEVDKYLGKHVPLSILADTPTIRGVSNFISSNTPQKKNKDIVVIKQGNNLPPLFCLDGVFRYKDLAISLGIERTICGVYIEEESSLMKLGQNSEEYRLYSTVDSISSRFTKSIRAYQIHGPYYLCGHSFGGILALEVARKLQNDGETVQLVAMFDSLSPALFQRTSALQRVRSHLRRVMQSGWPYLKDKILTKLEKYTMRLALFAGIGNQLVIDRIDIHRILKDQAFKIYSPETYQGEVMLFVGNDPGTYDFETPSNDLGWGKYIQNLAVHQINAGHWVMLEQGNVDEVSSMLSEKLR